MAAPAGNKDRAVALPWYVTKDLAALAVVTVVAITVIVVLTILPAPTSAPDRQVSLQSAATSPTGASGSAPASAAADLAPRTPVAAPLATDVDVAAEVLGTGGGSGSVSGLSADGTAVGTVTEDGRTHAVRWTTHGTAAGSVPSSALPGALVGDSATANGVTPAIAENGVIAFTASSGGGSRPVALVRSQARTSDRLGRGRVVGVSAQGQVLVKDRDALSVWDPASGTVTAVDADGSMITGDGSVLVPGNGTAPSVWHQRTVTPLAVGGHRAKVYGGCGVQSMVGQVSAEAGTGSGPGSARAALWRQGRLTLLPGLGGPAAARDVNQAGTVVGAALLRSGQAHAMRWTASSGSGQDLGTLGGSVSWALDVNEQGVAAGWSTSRTGVEHAAAWMPDGHVVDLGQSLGANVRTRATGIVGNRVYGTRLGPGRTTTPIVWTLTARS